MPLRERLVQQGQWLFRWRGYLPVLMVPLMLVALGEFGVIERALGDVVEDAWELLCLALAVVGLGIRCATVGYAPKGTSGRTTRVQRAAALNTTGMYSLVRHPLYLGNFLIMAGIALQIAVWWFVTIVVLAFWLYYERIMIAEEAYLSERFGPEYVAWDRRTPSIVPRIRNWQAPRRGFSWREVLRREYSGFYVIVYGFTMFEILEHLVIETEEPMEMSWVIFFVVGTALFLALRTLKKHTNLLRAGGAQRMAVAGRRWGSPPRGSD